MASIIKKRQKVFGEDGYQATVKELCNNSFDRKCINMLTPTVTTYDIKKKAILYLIFLKRKQCEKLKA